jgi:DNA-binding NtrC family response regulator
VEDPQSSAGDQLNVLVIDDDDAVRDLLCSIVHRGGHQVVAVASAEEGLEALPYWTFQVAVLDQNLPGMEGVVMAEYLRRNNPDMEIALVTGEEDRKLARRSRDLSIAYITKPFEVGAILDLIDRYLAGARTRRERRLRREEPGFDPPLADWIQELRAAYDVPSVPARLSERLTETLKRSLNDLRSVGRYNERDRVIALAGLIAAAVLGIDLPNAGDRTLYQEYDALMKEHGRRREFERQR